MLNVKVFVTLKKSIADPQGNAIKNALLSMGYNGISDVRMGKMIELRLDGLSRSQAEESVEGMCQRLLANTVIEDYSFEITEV
jgi:phosphoribosylformylglycinamidine synthase PurS subunit